MTVKEILVVLMALFAVANMQRFRPPSPGGGGARRPPPPPPFVNPRPPPPRPGFESQRVFDLPDGVEFIVGQVRAGFGCDGRRYGYYADVGNDCRIFHVCVPIEDEFGRLTDTQQYSFFCGNQTMFNQATLTCEFQENVDCARSEFFYSVNDNFGIIPPPNRQG